MTEINQVERLGPSERKILELVWREGPLARSAIAVRTGLADASVTRLTRELDARGYVSETVLREGLRGQPSRPLSVRPEGAYAFGVNFSHSYIDLGLIDLAGRLVAKQREPLDAATPERIAELASLGLRRQLASTGVPIEKVIGAGFSLPGDFLETPNFLHAHAAFPGLRERDLEHVFSEAMPVPIFVENDGTSAALGERVHGDGRRLDSFLFLHIGHGVGAGLVLDGQPWRGARGNAGTLGVIYPMSERRPSGQDLLETLKAAGVAVDDFNDLENLHPADCPPLRRWLVRAGEQLGRGLHLASRIIDPDAIILGGRLPPAINEAFAEAIDIDAAFASSKVLPYPRLIASGLGPYAGVIGAASVCFYKTFFSAGAAT